MMGEGEKEKFDKKLTANNICSINNTFTIDSESHIPVYVQISTWLCSRIRTGGLKEGEKLPTERVLSGQLGVARNTIKQAYGKLEQVGMIKTVQGSGSYVCGNFREEAGPHKACNEILETIIGTTISNLKNAGCGQLEIERLLMESAWSHLPKHEKIRLGWVDCSPEILEGTARELEEFCNISVMYFSYDEVKGNPKILLENGFDMIATTINHFDDIREFLNRADFNGTPSLEMVALAVGTQVISQIAAIQKNVPVCIVYDSEWYRFSVECYLNEYGFKGTCDYISLEEADHRFKMPPFACQVVILPPDPEYKNGIVGRIRDLCRQTDINSITFDQTVDQGSLFHLKHQVQTHWIKIM